MEMTYGLSITNNKDQFLRAAVEALELVNKAIIPGSFLVNTIPIRASQTSLKTTVRSLRDQNQ